MQRIFEIVFELKFSKATFYGVKDIESDISLFGDFINRISQSKHSNELQHIHLYISKLGKYGAFHERFRFEKHAHALPDFETKNHLRLYCLRISDGIVILFNGDFKTSQTAQQCPMVKPHFDLANLITQKIDEAIKEKDIIIDTENNTLLFEEKFRIEL